MKRNSRLQGLWTWALVGALAGVVGMGVTALALGAAQALIEAGW